MKPFRPYETYHDYKDDVSVYRSKIVLNLFDIQLYLEANNKHLGFDDSVKRTEVINGHNNSFYITVPFVAFDSVMRDFYRHYQLLDDRSEIIEPKKIPDSQKYTGFMDTRFSVSKTQVSAAFHRKGYEITDIEDAVFHCLFKNITPLN